MFYAHVGVSIVDPDRPLATILTAIPHGRSSILFAVLAGISLAILTGRPEPYSGEKALAARLRVFGRSCVLLVISGFLAIFNTMIALILAYYAAWFVAALPFARWNARRLFTAAGVLGVVGPTVNIVLDWVLTNLGFWGGDANSFVVEVFITGSYWGAVYLAMVLLGLGLGRIDLSLPRVHATLVGVGSSLALLGYGTSLVLTRAFAATDTTPLDGLESGSVTDGRWAGTDFPPISQFVTAEPHSGTAFEAIGSGGFALIVLGICLVCGSAMDRHAPVRRALFPLTALGSMSLTAYSAHVFFLSFMDDWFFTESWAPILWLTGTALVVCPLWKLRFQRGPLEWVTWRVSLMVSGTTPPASAHNSSLAPSAGPVRAVPSSLGAQFPAPDASPEDTR